MMPTKKHDTPKAHGSFIYIELMVASIDDTAAAIIAEVNASA